MKKPIQNLVYAFVLGIDVSKESLDACLIRTADGQVLEQKFNNNSEGFKKLKAFCKQHGCELGLATFDWRRFLSSFGGKSKGNHENKASF